MTEPRYDLQMSAAVQWGLTNQEIDVYKIALIYQKEFFAVFGKDVDGITIRMNTLPGKGNPIKSNLFKNCWRLARETRGLLESHEYQNYIKANLIILQINNAHISPEGICGDKAWIRYKVWKRRFDRKLSEVSATPPPPSISTTNPKVIAEIDRSKRFLFEKCEGQPTLDKIKEFIKQGQFKFWVATGKLSQYYVVNSPLVKAAVTEVDQLATICLFSGPLVRERTTPELLEYFKYEFAYEFAI